VNEESLLGEREGEEEREAREGQERVETASLHTSSFFIAALLESLALELCEAGGYVRKEKAGEADSWKEEDDIVSKVRIHVFNWFLCGNE
jgi:hypothetical protein